MLGEIIPEDELRAAVSRLVASELVSQRATLPDTVMLRVDRGEPELALQRLEEADALASEQRLGFVWEPRFLRGASKRRPPPGLKRTAIGAASPLPRVSALVSGSE